LFERPGEGVGGVGVREEGHGAVVTQVEAEDGFELGEVSGIECGVFGLKGIEECGKK
jgi:hypothetical protein